MNKLTEGKSVEALKALAYDISIDLGRIQNNYNQRAEQLKSVNVAIQAAQEKKEEPK